MAEELVELRAAIAHELAKQIAARYGIGTEVVWRALKAHRAKIREDAP